MYRFSVLFSVFLLMDAATAAEGDVCYSTGGIAGIVLATIAVTLITSAIALFAVWYFYNKRSARRNGVEEENLSQKAIPELDSKYAFDNPYFRDDETDKATVDDAEKGQAGITSDNGTVVQPNFTVFPPKNKKLKLAKNHPFSSVFHGVKKQRSRDDSYLAVEPERITVPLRGHDFTGLGFNICGNMRDGIFVKDVLHHGPASESGKIRAGDRILSVTVSFNNMVYEDALTILSYASPYNVHLELAKATEKSQVMPTSPGKRLGSVSFRSGGQRLFHPLYRSQSIDDLTQIGKETYPNQELAPKRSQSIGLTTNQKPNRPYLRNADSLPEEADRSAAALISTGSLDEEALAVLAEETLQKSLSSDSKLEFIEDTDSCKVQDDNVPKDEEESKNSNLVSPEDVKITLTHSEENDKYDSDKEDDKPPQPYPRRGGTPGKRKAPAPPKPPHGNSAETIAQIHQVDSDELDCKNSKLDKSNNSKETCDIPQIKKLKDGGENDSLDTESLHDDIGSHSDVSNDSLELGIPEEPKRKSSSLGDLTKLEEISTKKSPTLLERAVSLDLKQDSIPDSNLVQQKKILKPPDFDRSDSTDVSTEQNGSIENDLKKWNVGDKQINMSSTECQSEIFNDSQKNDVEFETASEPSTASHSPSLSISSDNETKTITSTPIKKVIQADTLLTTDLKLNQEHNQNGVPRENEHKLGKNHTDSAISIEIPVIPPVIKQLEKREHPSPPVVLQSYQPSSQQKEVIEISEKELDNIMMSHKQFLLKQAKATGVYTNLNPDASKTDAEIEFESWSYTDEQNSKQTINGNESDTSTSHYNTGLEMSSELSETKEAPLWKQAGLYEEDNAPLWKQKDTSQEYTVRTPGGGYTKTIIITSSGDVPSKDPSLPKLQPSCN
ncbi:uncharacterized protein LOC111640485 [Centruroides sculpturatus]|uniref:uncharacterized protein LOC111640485 n=1 Tax=Centruroides sculpturatus TaxID=218467 RepID=UPI000C6E0A3A|nr:uncharacterized protein LOC111640485 [Centruroides sculpturatus]